jgi:FtsH-binding integral membrane protein
MKIFSILIGILAIMLILNLLSNSFLNLIISVLGVVEITLVFIVYHQLRKRIDAKL